MSRHYNALKITLLIASRLVQYNKFRRYDVILTSQTDKYKLPRHSSLVLTCVLFVAIIFQENLLKTMLQIENTFFELAATCKRNCLIICDRGAMDASACKWPSTYCKKNVGLVYIDRTREKERKSLIQANNIFHVAVISTEKWEKMMKDNNWHNVELRDNRYNQIVHMVSAANGAEDFYSTEVLFKKKNH